MSKSYANSFKEQVVKKVLSKDNHTSIMEIANSYNIPKSTLYGWTKQLNHNKKNSFLSREENFEKKFVNGFLKSVFKQS